MRIGDENAFFADFERPLSRAALESILAEHGPLKRRPPRLSAPELLAGLVYHVSQPGGTFGAHLRELTGRRISEAAASERRLAMPWEVFAAILESALGAPDRVPVFVRPLAAAVRTLVNHRR